jgi:uncharacterized protein YlxW (UPF0749 family)
MPHGFVLWGAKLSGVWMGGFASLIADVQFAPTGLLGVAGGVFIILGTAWFTIRTNAVKFWREERDAEKARADRAEKEAKEQRELKHSALSELAAERMKTDITPVLAELASQKSADAAMFGALEALTESVKVNTATLKGLVVHITGKDVP